MRRPGLFASEFVGETATEEAEDVIILPGESLAKYRNKPTVHEFVPPPAKRESVHGEIEAEAEELELTDKVFAHRDESVEAEEDKCRKWSRIIRLTRSWKR